MAGSTPDPADPTTLPPWQGIVHPFNPCLPHPESRTCRRYTTTASEEWAPFNEDEKYYWIKN